MPPRVMPTIRQSGAMLNQICTLIDRIHTGTLTARQTDTHTHTGKRQECWGLKQVFTLY